MNIRFSRDLARGVRNRVAQVTGLGALAVVAMVSGCATSSSSTPGVTASDSTRLTQSGFLSDYSRLKVQPASGGLECWRDAGVDAKKYDKVVISRIMVSIKDTPGAPPLVDPTDLKALTDYFHEALTKALAPQIAVASETGPGVVVIRVALTQLMPTEVSRSVAGTLVPYGFVAEAGSGAAAGRPAGSTPYMGETAMEMQFVDGGSKAVLGECRDTQVGRKYAADMDAGTAGAAQTWASGYANSFQSWAYAKSAFDKWSMIVAKRFGELRAMPG